MGGHIMRKLRGVQQAGERLEMVCRLQLNFIHSKSQSISSDFHRVSLRLLWPIEHEWKCCVSIQSGKARLTCPKAHDSCYRKDVCHEILYQCSYQVRILLRCTLEVQHSSASSRTTWFMGAAKSPVTTRSLAKNIPSRKWRKRG